MVLSSRSVLVTWDPPAPESNVTSYTIVYTTTANYTTGGDVTVAGYSSTSGVLSGLQESTLYTIIVQAIADSGRSGNSEEARVTTYTASEYIRSP